MHFIYIVLLQMLKNTLQVWQRHKARGKNNWMQGEGGTYK